MIRDIEGFRPKADTGDARLGRLKSPWAEGGGEAVVPLATFANCIGSMLGDPRGIGSWEVKGRREVVGEVKVSIRWLSDSI